MYSKRLLKESAVNSIMKNGGRCDVYSYLFDFVPDGFF